MAQFVPYIPEVFPETPLFTPDMNFFDRMMQRKQSMFEQGLSKSRTAYNSVLNAPLSAKENIPLRDQFIKDAKENLQSLASADLSLPQNVAAAENIFSPFWQDKYIMKDMELTKSYQSGFQLLDSWKNSSDPKVREQYSGITERYLMNGYDKLQNASRNDQSFSTIERRKPVAFTNIQAYLEDAASKSQDKLQIVWDKLSPDGAYLISSTNGERVKQSFASWAQSQIGNNFYQQFNVTGIVEKEERLKMIKNAFPGISDVEANKKLGESVITELNDGYTRRKNNIDVEAARIKSTLNAMPDTLTPEQQKQADILAEQLAVIEGKRSAIDVDYKNFNQSKDVTLQSVLQNPDNYFATLAKQRVIDGWATGRASIESNKVTTNEAYFKAQDLYFKQKEYERNIAKDKWDQQVDQWNMANGNKAGKNPKTGGNVGNEPTDPTLTEGYDPTSTGTYKGLGNTDISKTGTAYDNYVKKMNEKFLTAHDRIFNTSGVLMFTKNLGLNNEDLMNVSSALQKEIRSVKSGGGYRFTPAEKTASNKLTNLLLQNEGVKAAGIKDIKGPYGLRNALVAYAKDYLEDRNEQSKDGIAFLKSDEMNALMDYVTANQDLAAYEANEKKRNELVKRNILGDPKTYGKIIVDRNGEKDILTPTDMAKDMPSLELFGTIDGSVLKLSKQQVAEAYAQGELSGTRIGELTYNGKNYTFRKVNDKTSSTAFGLADNTAALWNDIYSNVLVPKYGTPDELNKLLTAANTSVVPDLLFYQSQTGKMGVEFSYTFDNKKPLAQDKGARIFNAALSTANSEFYDIDGKPLSTDMIQKITSLLNGEDAWEKYVDKFDYVTQGINGLPTIRFSISDKPSESGKAGVDVSAIKSQIFNLAILPTNTSPDLRDLPNNTGMYMYDQLLRGETVKSDPVISASGFEFEIVPNNNTDPDKVNVSLKYNIRVNNRLPSGEIVTSIKPFSAEESFNLKGSGAKTPDEVVSYIYSLYFRNMEQNKMTQEEYNRTLSTNPGTTTVSKEQYLNSKGVKLK